MQCQHSRAVRNNNHPAPHDYICAAYAPTVIRPAERCPIYCHEKNDRGQCDRFGARLVQIETEPEYAATSVPKRPWLRRVADLIFRPKAAE